MKLSKIQLKRAVFDPGSVQDSILNRKNTFIDSAYDLTVEGAVLLVRHVQTGRSVVLALSDLDYALPVLERVASAQGKVVKK